MIQKFTRTDRAASLHLLSDHVRRSQITTVDRRDHDWIFQFSSGLQMQVFGIWRILADGLMPITSEDDGQLFGLSEPVDAKTQVMALFRSKTILDFSIREFSADLLFTLDTGVQLEILSISGGYENWLIVGQQFQIVGQGGGQILMWSAE